MANINFLLNNGRKSFDKKTPQRIYIRYRVGRKVDFSASIGVSVLFDDWNEKKQKIKDRSHILDRLSTNTLIENLQTHFFTYNKKNKEIGYTPTRKEVKEYFDSFFSSKEETEVKISFFDYVDKFIERARTQPNTTTKKLVSQNTIKDYRTVKNNLQEFNDQVYPITFENISMDFYHDFLDFCNDKGFKTNYTGKQIKTLKTFLNSALEDGLTTNITHTKKSFSVLTEEPVSIYLDEDEIYSLCQLDLTDQPQKEIARDLFVIGCYTGLRYSDYHFNKDDFKTIKGVEMLVLKTRKTNTTVSVPLHPILREILLKYDYTPPKMFVQVLNRLIKEVGRMAQIDNNVTIEYTRSGQQIKEVKKKYELIASHTARRSFCTNAYLSGLKMLDIMSISGHTTVKNFKKYIKVTSEERAVKISQQAFFRPKLKAV